MALKSAQGGEADKVDVEELLDYVDKTLDRVKTLYEQYFLGIQKQPPAHLHGDVERRLRDLTQMQIRNTGLRYRFATLQQKFGSYNSYWRRTLRQIENGTYARNLAKLGRRAAQTGEEIPEEILAAMPKRMREQVKRDREAALAIARRREQTVDDGAFLDDEPAVIGEAPAVREQITRGGAHVLADDGDFDIDAFFASVTDEDEHTTSSAPPKPAPAAPASRPSAPATAEPARRPPEQRFLRADTDVDRGEFADDTQDGVPAFVDRPAAPVAPVIPTSRQTGPIPVIVSSSGPVPAVPASRQTGAIPTQTGAIPTQTGMIPTQTGMIPTQTGAIPTQTGMIPTQTGAIPTQTGAIPTMPASRQTGPIPTQTGVIPTTPASRQTGPIPTQTGASPTAPASRQTGPIPTAPRPPAPPPLPPRTQPLPRVATNPGAAGMAPPSASGIPGAMPGGYGPGDSGSMRTQPLPRAGTVPGTGPGAAGARPGTAPAPSQVTRPLPITPGASQNRPATPVESMNGPFPRAPSNPPPAGTTQAIPRPPPPPAGTTQAIPRPAPPPVAPRQEPPRVAPKAPAAAPTRPPPGMNDADVNALYAKYVQAKKTVGEDAGPGAYGKLLATINAQAPKIMQQYNAKAVEFSVVVKDNQVVIKAKPK